VDMLRATPYGFDWGPMRVERAVFDNELGWVLVVRPVGKDYPRVEIKCSPAGCNWSAMTYGRVQSRTSAPSGRCRALSHIGDYALMGEIEARDVRIASLTSSSFPVVGGGLGQGDPVTNEWDVVLEAVSLAYDEPSEAHYALERIRDHVEDAERRVRELEQAVAMQQLAEQRVRELEEGLQELAALAQREIEKNPALGIPNYRKGALARRALELAGGPYYDVADQGGSREHR
jgi:hypothetical protein